MRATDSRRLHSSVIPARLRADLSFHVSSRLLAIIVVSRLRRSYLPPRDPVASRARNLKNGSADGFGCHRSNFSN